MNLMDALLPVIAIAFEKQLHLADIVGNRSWSFSMDSGEVRFDNDFAFKVQLLGTEADAGQTWLWAWANSASGIPLELLDSAHQMRAYGHQTQIRALTETEVPLDNLHNGHMFSMLASGLLESSGGYYRGPYPGGALFMLIDDRDFPTDLRDPVQRIGVTFPQLISAIALPSHLEAFLGYLQAHQLTVEHEAESQIVQAQSGNGQVIRAEFDASDRLMSLNASLHP